ncbi:hypothetical protein ACTPOE_16190 [Castellaniella sp. WN]
MKADFLDAHLRHWEDAERLFQAGRLANADHLYGMAAECGLKSLMLEFGMPFDILKDRPDERKDREHINLIWTRFEVYRSGSARGTGYVLSAAGTEPFADWRASDRYAHQSGFSQDFVQGHQKGASLVIDLVKKAQREGWLA